MLLPVLALHAKAGKTAMVLCYKMIYQHQKSPFKIIFPIFIYKMDCYAHFKDYWNWKIFA